MGNVKKLALAIALWGSLIASPVHAKTFVGVLWPMFGPLPAIGLVELVAEIKTMPDVEVKTYLHQEWPSLVKDMSHLPDGTRTIVIGYSLGANATPSVANNSKYIDLIIALQPSMLSWNPPFTGKVGRIIEVYNPNPWLTFGGMGSKKLVGPNIEYIANTDSHPGAQFSSEFRDLVKTEVAKSTAEDRVETAQADTPKALAYAEPPGAKPAPKFEPADNLLTSQQRDSAQKDSGQKDSGQKDLKQGNPAVQDLHQQDRRQTAQAATPKTPKPVQLAAAPTDRQPKEQLREQPGKQPKELMAFLDDLSSSVSSGDLSAQRPLTADDLKDYAKRTYRGSPAAGLTATASD